MYLAERLEKDMSTPNQIVGFTEPYRMFRERATATKPQPSEEIGIILQFRRGPYNITSTIDNPRPKAPVLWEGRNTLTPGMVTDYERRNFILGSWDK